MTVDFLHALEPARLAINRRVEEQTEEKIKDLIASGVLDTTTRLVLTNAIYFKGDWSRPFKPAATYQDDFHLADGRKVKVPLMRQTDDFGYAEDDRVQALQMHYRGGYLSMTVVLPKAKDGLAEIESDLTPEKLEAWHKALHDREVIVTFPKFTMTSEFDLGRTLGQLGMPLVFSDQADFSGISPGPEPLKISAVIHKAFVDVNETGTEAAAATAIGLAAAAAPLPTQPVVFRADHPFLFLIRDRQSGSILFLGRVSQPGH